MRPLSGLGSEIISTVIQWQVRKGLGDPGPLSEFYRNGGNAQLYLGLHLSVSDLVLDVGGGGGYYGEWTSGILIRYGCRSEIFEPVSAFMDECKQLFRQNSRVRLHQEAMGGSSRTATIILAEAGTSEFISGTGSGGFEAQVMGVGDYLRQLTRTVFIADTPGGIGCLKFNIEGCEYEVLEKLIENDEIERFHTLLIQFYRQPTGRRGINGFLMRFRPRTSEPGVIQWHGIVGTCDP